MSAEALPNEASEPPPEEEQSFRGTVALETPRLQAQPSPIARPLRGAFKEAGYRLVSLAQHADVYVVNTCTVTHVADSKARQALRSAHRRNPDATVVATGCYAQRDPAAITALQGVDLVLGNTEKPGLVERGTGNAWRCSSISDGYGSTTTPSVFRPGRFRAMVKIQEGCNQVCRLLHRTQGQGPGAEHPACRTGISTASPRVGRLSRGGADRHPAGLLWIRPRRPGV